MTKIFHRQGVISGDLANFKGLFFHVTQDKGDILVSPKNFGQPAEPYRLRSVAQELKEAAPLVVYFSLSTGEFINAWDQSTRSARDEFMLLHNSAIFAFSLTKYSGEYVFTFGVPVLPGLEAEIKAVDPGMSTLRVLSSELPGFDEHPTVVLRRERYKVLYGINPTDSLSDLEKQVDILTEVLVKLVEASNIPERVDLSVALRQLLGAASTTQLGFETCVADAVAQKVKTRSTLAPYYKLKGKNA